VAAIEQFGVLMDLDGPPEPSVGRIPVPQLSWEWISDSSQVVTVGRQVTVEVVGVDTKLRGQAVLSLRALQANPWLPWADQVGSVIRGRVTKLVRTKPGHPLGRERVFEVRTGKSTATCLFCGRRAQPPEARVR